MPKRVNSVSELPKWYGLARYAWIADASDEEIYSQIKGRRLVFDFLDDPKFRKETFFDELEVATLSDTVGKVGVKWNFSGIKMGGERRLAGSLIVKPLSIHAINFYSDALSRRFPEARRLLDEGTDEEARAVIKEGQETSFAAQDFPKDDDQDVGAIQVEIDLFSPDEVIISELRQMLPMWREQLTSLHGVDLTSEDVRAGWPSKVRRDRVIPILDLLLWSKAYDLVIPNRVLAIAVFPNGERGEQDLQKTIVPFAKSFFYHKKVMALNGAIRKERKEI